MYGVPLFKKVAPELRSGRSLDALRDEGSSHDRRGEKTHGRRGTPRGA